ncbi:hypothetical protein F5148DRAFT_973393 [Russula earlei]|uniref:Uncharacterized protein n=1 Tax=Russula earlei TaxID=71964 RepID=A0ACC0UNY3_9AGAM|nr:hypothetical protein F5148DRAFT_973393 [Russula earlei]
MSSHRQLAPGFRQVDAFDSDERYERDEKGDIIEEISYVTLDLGAVEPTLLPSSSTYRLIGLDTPSPFLQLSGTIFQGTNQSLLGTELLFAEDKDLQDQTRRKVSHLANTSQRIRFKQVELQPKDAALGQPRIPSSTPDKGRGTSSKQNQNAAGDDDIVDLMTGNTELADIPPQRRKGGKGKAKQRIESQPS